MRLNVRLGDAHYPYAIPVPRVRDRVVLVDDIIPEPVYGPHKVSVPELPKVPYQSPEQPPCTTTVLPYDWAKRRDGVMARFKSVRNWVQPIGYIAPYEPKPLPGKSLTQQDRDKELTYLIETQHLDLAPMWAELAANGLTAYSKDSTVTTEDGEVESGDVPEALGDNSALARQYESGRKEQFARETDYAAWHTPRGQRRAQFVTNDEGKRGVIPKPGSVFTKPELQAMLARRPVEKPEEGEVGEWLDSLPAHDFETDDQLARYEADRHTGFNSGEPCPEQQQTRIDGSPLCQKGEVPVTIDGEVHYYEECPTCGGNGSVLSLLGCDLPVVDG